MSLTTPSNGAYDTQRTTALPPNTGDYAGDLIATDGLAVPTCKSRPVFKAKADTRSRDRSYGSDGGGADPRPVASSFAVSGAFEADR